MLVKNLEVNCAKFSYFHHFLIVSGVEICKQCLQTAPASDPLPGLRPWTPLGDFLQDFIEKNCQTDTF